VIGLGAREATSEDVPVLVELYRKLEDEMTALHPMWPIASGLDEPVADTFIATLSDPETIVLIGTIDDYPFGFILATEEEMLVQAQGEKIGSIRFVFVDHDAREVGVGEVMREKALDLLRARGITKFDAHVLPGHRLVKNFFESGGFSARTIVMHHDDARS
jgi:GNAT superfamily N-acetyltransferase